MPRGRRSSRSMTPWRSGTATPGPKSVLFGGTGQAARASMACRGSWRRQSTRHSRGRGGGSRASWSFRAPPEKFAYSTDLLPGPRRHRQVVGRTEGIEASGGAEGQRLLRRLGRQLSNELKNGLTSVTTCTQLLAMKGSAPGRNKGNGRNHEQGRVSGSAGLRTTSTSFRGRAWSSATFPTSPRSSRRPGKGPFPTRSARASWNRRATAPRYRSTATGRRSRWRSRRYS